MMLPLIVIMAMMIMFRVMVMISLAIFTPEYMYSARLMITQLRIDLRPKCDE
ncbi:MAG: hypothetical protein MI748_04385 [Opitutales bacterium]|nr:hypothetical protein [Opitutales bacterium]